MVYVGGRVGGACPVELYVRGCVPRTATLPCPGTPGWREFVWLGLGRVEEEGSPSGLEWRIPLEPPLCARLGLGDRGCRFSLSRLLAVEDHG